MSFKKGEPRPEGAGRKKGTPNKKTVAKVSELLAEKNLNPAEEILKIIGEKKLDKKGNETSEYAMSSDGRASLWLELLSYCHAKPKPFEASPEDNFNLDEFDDVPTADLMKVAVGKTSTTGTA